MTCFLCTQCASSDAIELRSAEAAEIKLKEIIEKHFWLRIDSGEANYVCRSCWEQVSQFHNFYENVQQAHQALLEKSGAVEIPVKSEILPERESVAAAVKRRRGRPRKSEETDAAMANEELKAVLEQINLNEIKIEFPEADLTMADVLQDEQDEEEEAETEEYLDERYEEEDDDEAEIDPPSKKPRKGRPRGRGRGRGISSKPPARAGETNKQKSNEFNDYIREHYKVQCHVCSLPQEGFSEMLVHMRQEHQQRGYAMCCNHKFYKRGVLVDHLRRHQDPELFKCHLCDRVMGQRRSLELHMRMHEIKSRGRLYQCDQCSKSFFSPIVCERHKLTHIPKEQWQVGCTHTNCDKTFPNQYTMQQHVKLVHLNLYAKICDVCGKSIRGREALARHMEEHTGTPQKAIKCDLCDSILTTKYGLARHIKMMHTAENLQPMQCEFCLKISPSLQAHQHHIKYTHNTARTHQCPMCEKAFKRPKELREHMTTHTGEVLYTCPHCTQTFNSNANMHAHRKKMHRKEWEEYRIQAKNRKTDTIIAVCVRKTTESRQDDKKEVVPSALE